MWRNLLVTSTLLVTGLLAGFKAHANSSRYTAFRKALSASEQALHVTDRLTFGARRIDISHFRAIGRKRWIDEQLHPERTPENSQLLRHLQQLASLRMSPHDLVMYYPPPKVIAAAVKSNAEGHAQPVAQPASPRRAIAEELSEAKLMRAVYSNHQLPEMLDVFGTTTSTSS